MVDRVDRLRTANRGFTPTIADPWRRGFGRSSPMIKGEILPQRNETGAAVRRPGCKRPPDWRLPTPMVNRDHRLRTANRGSAQTIADPWRRGVRRSSQMIKGEVLPQRSETGRRCACPGAVGSINPCRGDACVALFVKGLQIGDYRPRWLTAFLDRERRTADWRRRSPIMAARLW